LLPLSTLITRLSTAPARLLGLAGGSLGIGAAGDVTILDLERPVTVDVARFQSRSRNTPFGDWHLTGAPVATVVNGTPVA
jgi:dihydroorotase